MTNKILSFSKSMHECCFSWSRISYHHHNGIHYSLAIKYIEEFNIFILGFPFSLDRESKHDSIFWLNCTWTIWIEMTYFLCEFFPSFEWPIPSGDMILKEGERRPKSIKLMSCGLIPEYFVYLRSTIKLIFNFIEFNNTSCTKCYINTSWPNSSTSIFEVWSKWWKILYLISCFTFKGSSFGCSHFFCSLLVISFGIQHHSCDICNNQLFIKRDEMNR